MSNKWYDDTDDFNKDDVNDDNKNADGLDDLRVTDEEFDSLEDILCETCGEPCEHRHLLEDTDFDTVLQVCDDCVKDLPDEDPDRFRQIG